MAIEYDIIEEKRLIIAKGSGVVTGNDVLEHLDTISADERYVAPMKKLVDYRYIESIMISVDEAYVIAQKKEELGNKFTEERCAFVSPGDLTYGTSRVHQSLIAQTDINTEVFRQLEDALEWLGVELEMYSE